MINCCYNAWDFGKFNWECNRLAIVREGRSINNSPLLLHANGKPLHTNIVTMIVIFPVEAISSYRVTFGKQTRSASVQAKNIDKIYNALKGNRESNASFRFSG